MAGGGQLVVNMATDKAVDRVIEALGGVALGDGLCVLRPEGKAEQQHQKYTT